MQLHEYVCYTRGVCILVSEQNYHDFSTIIRESVGELCFQHVSS